MNKDYKELIERFIDGELDENEKASFLKELEHNTALSEEFEFYQLANSFVVQTKFSQIESTIQEVHEEYKTSQKKQKTIKVVAIASLILGAGSFLLLKKNPQPEKETHPTISTQDTVRSHSETKDSVSFQVIENKEVNKSKVEQKKSLPVQKEESKTSVLKNKQESEEKQNEENPTLKSLQTNTISPIKETTTAPEVKNSIPEISPCEAIKISFQPISKATCTGENKGEIRVSDVKGGKTPYQFRISTGQENSSGTFEQLAAGVYTIQVLDANDCKSKSISVEIKTEMCKLNLVLDPASGNGLSFPIYEKDGVLTIFDKKGTTIFSNRINSKAEFNWTGEVQEGNLNPGYYIFVIQYSDGNTQNGTITVTP